MHDTSHPLFYLNVLDFQFNFQATILIYQLCVHTFQSTGYASLYTSPYTLW
jgi:hypothetical protein